MRFLRETAISAGDASGNLQSQAIDASYIIAASCQFIVTGTAVGTAKLQYSNDSAFAIPNTQNPTNWSDIPSASVAIAGAGTYSIPKLDMCYQWIRVTFTFTSDAGTLTANLKSIGF